MAPTRQVAVERIEPDIHGLLGVARNRNAPLHRGTGDGEIAHPLLHPAKHLVAPRLGLHKACSPGRTASAAGRKRAEHRQCRMGKARPFQKGSAPLSPAGKQVRLEPSLHAPSPAWHLHSPEGAAKPAWRSLRTNLGCCTAPPAAAGTWTAQRSSSPPCGSRTACGAPGSSSLHAQARGGGGLTAAGEARSARGA